jgi:hypothetical protein
VEQADVLRYAVQTLERLGISYAVVGAFASGAWGESRFTQDIDIVIDLQPGQVRPICEAFPAPDFYISEAAAREAVAQHSQFNVIHPSSGNKIDFMIAGTSQWSAAQLERRKRVPLFPDCSGYLAAPEDVILGKLLYYAEGGSEKHLRDIAGILKISGEAVDREYIAQHAADLGVVNIWQLISQQVEKP